MSPHILIDGAPATVADLATLALVNYGGFTVMRVEDGGVRGLDLHLARLRATALELFGVAVPEARLRDLMRRAIADQTGPDRTGSVTLRVNLFSDAITVRDPSVSGQPRVMTTVTAAAASAMTPLRLTTSSYRRETPHLKHVGAFGLIRERRLALAAGYDDVLFVDDERGQGPFVTEGSIWNIGFRQGDTIVWPLAPMLAGTGQALVQRGLDRLGMPSETRPIHLDEIETFDGAFTVNASAVGRPIASIGHVLFERVGTGDDVRAAWAVNPLQPI